MTAAPHLPHHRTGLRVAARLLVAALALLHGAVHLIGFAAAPGAPVPPEELAPWMTTGTVGGYAWLAAAALLVATALLLAADRPDWWRLGAVAVLASQALLATQWAHARAGTIANLVLALAVVHGWCATGDRSARARYRRGVRHALATIPGVPSVARPVTDRDLDHLPPQVARYLRRTGSVGLPPVDRVRVALRGRIRSGPAERWMTFTGEQVNTSGPRPTRHVLLDATASGLPVDVLHELEGGHATMRADLLSAIPVVRGAGTEMDRGESVTLFNDLCLLTPSALVSAPVTWEALGPDRVRGAFRHGAHTVSAVLVFDTDGDLADFVSDDRFRASADGRSFVPERWSTPVSAYAPRHGRRLPTTARAMWHPASGTPFVYAEMTIEDVTEVGLTAR